MSIQIDTFITKECTTGKQWCDDDDDGYTKLVSRKGVIASRSVLQRQDNGRLVALQGNIQANLVPLEYVMDIIVEVSSCKNRRNVELYPPSILTPSPTTHLKS